MKRRETELAVREEMLAKREKELAAPAATAPAETKKGQSAVERLTKAPLSGTPALVITNSGSAV